MKRLLIIALISLLPWSAHAMDTPSRFSPRGQLDTWTLLHQLRLLIQHLHQRHFVEDVEDDDDDHDGVALHEPGVLPEEGPAE